MALAEDWVGYRVVRLGTSLMAQHSLVLPLREMTPLWSKFCHLP